MQFLLHLNKVIEMKVDLSKKQRVLIMSCINERLQVLNQSLKKESKTPKPDKKWIKAYQSRIEIINELISIIQIK